MAQPIFPAFVAYDHNKGSYVEEYAASQTAGETFIYGEFFKLTAGVAIRCGADPAVIAGISEINTLATASVAAPTTITPNGKVPLRMLNEECVIGFSSTTVPVDATHLQNNYGITRTSAGIWQLDVSKTGGSARVHVVRLDIPNGIWYAKVIAAYLPDTTIVS